MQIRSTPLRYSLAVGLTFLALLLTILLPLLPKEGIFVLPLAAIILTAWYGGRGPGLLAMLLSAGAIDYFFIPPVGSLAILPWENALGLTVFAAVALLLIEFSEARRRDERALQDSEERWRAVFEHNPTMYFMVDAAGTVLSVNPFGAEQLGYTVDELVGRPVLNVFYEADREAVRRNVSICLEQLGRAMSWEFRKVRKDGTVIWVRERAQAVRMATNQSVVLIVCEDVTERKQAEEALQESEARLKLAQKAAGAGVWDWDIQSGRMNWSEEYCYLLGLKPDECEPSYENWLLRSVYPDDRSKVHRAVEETIKEKRDLALEYRIIRPNDEIRWLMRRGQMFHDTAGRPIRMAGITLDITDSKRAEALLDGEKRLLEMITRGDPHALLFDALCRVVEELFSGLQASILLLDPNGKRLWHGAAPSLPKSYVEAINGVAIGPSVGSCGTAAYRAQPVVVSDIATDPLWADYRDLGLAHGLRACWSTPILSTEGKVLGTFAIYYREPRSPSAQEIDAIERTTHLAGVAIERKRAEEALRTMQAELAQVSRTLTMRELTASIAHEVNQPLAAIVTNGNACLRWLSAAEPDINELRDAVTDIVNDANRASLVIGRIREFLRKQPPQSVPVDMNDLIREVVALVGTDVSSKGIMLRTDLVPALPMVMGDRVQLQQVLLNLVLNAVETMSAVAETARELVIRSDAHGSDEVLVEVRDTGVGLEPGHVDRIFTPFFTTKPTGMGMGLSISRSIIEAHGGKLWASPNEDKGATFHFTLPTG